MQWWQLQLVLMHWQVPLTGTAPSPEEASKGMAFDYGHKALSLGILYYAKPRSGQRVRRSEYQVSQPVDRCVCHSALLLHPRFICPWSRYLLMASPCMVLTASAGGNKGEHPAC